MTIATDRDADAVLCPACAAPQSLDARFCEECGAEQPKAKVPRQRATRAAKQPTARTQSRPARVTPPVELADPAPPELFASLQELRVQNPPEPELAAPSPSRRRRWRVVALSLVGVVLLGAVAMLETTTTTRTDGLMCRTRRSAPRS